MFSFHEYGTRNFVKAVYKTGNNICMVERDGKQRSWSVYDGDRSRDAGDIYDRRLGSFNSQREAFDFVREHYAPNYPVVSRDGYEGAYAIYYKTSEDPIGLVEKINTKKWGVSIFGMGADPVYTASTLKACREALKSGVKIEINFIAPESSVTPEALGTSTTSEVSRDEVKQSDAEYWAAIGFLTLIVGCAAYAVLISL